MWVNGNPTIQKDSDCDYTLMPISWEDCPIEVIPNYLDAVQVAENLGIANANKHHAVCNLGYTPYGGGRYLPQFRRSADLHKSFFGTKIWQDLGATCLRLARDKYGATYPADSPMSPNAHGFGTIYQNTAGVLGLHSDAGSRHGAVWKASVTTRYEMTALVYLTSYAKDFIGGIIRFPYILDAQGKPFEYAPKAGDALFFPAHPLFAHSVDASVGSRVLLGAWYMWRPYTYKLPI